MCDFWRQLKGYLVQSKDLQYQKKFLDQTTRLTRMIQALVESQNKSAERKSFLSEVGVVVLSELAPHLHVLP